MKFGQGMRIREEIPAIRGDLNELRSGGQNLDRIYMIHRINLANL